MKLTNKILLTCLLAACSSSKPEPSSEGAAAKPPGVGAVPNNASAATDAVPSDVPSDADALKVSYFAEIDEADRAVIYRVEEGVVTELFSGAPLRIPTAVARSRDGEMLYIADVGATASDGSETGAIFALPIAGGSPSIIATNAFRWPVDVSTSDGDTLIVTAEDSAGVPSAFPLSLD